VHCPGWNRQEKPRHRKGIHRTCHDNHGYLWLAVGEFAIGSTRAQGVAAIAKKQGSI
jgi:hypothetical protein